MFRGLLNYTRSVVVMTSLSWKKKTRTVESTRSASLFNNPDDEDEDEEAIEALGVLCKKKCVKSLMSAEDFMKRGVTFAEEGK